MFWGINEEMFFFFSASLEPASRVSSTSLSGLLEAGIWRSTFFRTSVPSFSRWVSQSERFRSSTAGGLSFFSSTLLWGFGGASSFSLGFSFWLSVIVLSSVLGAVAGSMVGLDGLVGFSVLGVSTGAGGVLGGSGFSSIRFSVFEEGLREFISEEKFF